MPSVVLGRDEASVQGDLYRKLECVGEFEQRAGEIQLTSISSLSCTISISAVQCLIQATFEPTIHLWITSISRGVYTHCDNLLRSRRTKPLPEYDDLTFHAMKLDYLQIERLTHLEITVPRYSFFGGRMGFSSTVVFPTLTELVVTSTYEARL